jgi:hypothetical protein
MLYQKSIGYDGDKNQQKTSRKLIKRIERNTKEKNIKYGFESMVDGGLLSKLIDFNDKMDTKKRRK